jgi:hypothetical protein
VINFLLGFLHVGAGSPSPLFLIELKGRGNLAPTIDILSINLNKNQRTGMFVPLFFGATPGVVPTSKNR